MKNLGLFCLLLTFLTLESCKKNDSEKDVNTQTLADKPESVQCFKALYEKDTLDLKINTLKSGKITGDMVMKIENMPIKDGRP